MSDSFPFIAAELQAPLAAVGALPPDLMAAFNGAVHAASLAQTIVSFLSAKTWSVPRWDSSARRKLSSRLSAMYDNANPARQALAAVVGKLNTARQARGPVRFGMQVRANAHEAALAGATDVRMRIRIALLASEVCNGPEPEAVLRLADELAAPMDLDLVGRYIGKVWRRFDRDGLPDFAEILAEIQIEASMAASTAGRAKRKRRRRAPQKRRRP